MKPYLLRFGLFLLSCSIVIACGVAPADPEPDPDDRCDAPAVGQSAEALSSVDCNQYADTGYTSGNTFAITLVTVDGKPVEMQTANAYYVMAQAAEAAGIQLSIVSGFRTMAEQQYLYNCYVNCSCNSCNLAAKPGYSNHQSGHALDLNTSSGGVYDWLAANAGNFGFSRTVPSEAWHWEWWGGGPGGGPCGTCTPHCEGSNIVGKDCGAGDCAAYGATCVDDSLGVRCASVFCPAVGQKKVCVNDKLIGDCNNGGITTGDCSAYGTVCIDDAKGARCVIVFCADRPTEAHDVCLPTGQLGHCTDVGGIDVVDCPADKPCTATDGAATCGAPSGSGGGSGNTNTGGTSTGGAGSGGKSGWGTGGSNAIKPGQGGSSNASPKVDDDAIHGKCACRAAGADRSLSPVLLFALAGLALRSRRRRLPASRVC